MLARVDSCRTRVDSCYTRVDSCWFVLDLCWFVLTPVGLVLTRVRLVLNRVDLCWYSCIRIDLIIIKWRNVFNSIKEINRLRKKINRLLSKRIWNIYVKVTIEKTDASIFLDFLSLKNLSPGQVLGAPAHAHIIEF